MAQPIDRILEVVGAPTFEQARTIAGLKYELAAAGVTGTLHASYPQARMLEAPRGARLLGMPVVAGPVGILVEAIR